MKIGITGADGYLGTKLVEYFSSKNYEVIKFVREPIINERRFELGKKLDEIMLLDIDILIHAAYDFNVKSNQELKAVNVSGSKDLFLLAKKSKVKKIIFISSISAFNGCHSRYGQTKLDIESMLMTTLNSYIIRPGIIWGGELGGVMKPLQKLAKLPIIPMVGANVIQYLVHYEDIAIVIDTLINKNFIELSNKPILVANKKGVLFADILKKLGAKVMISIPWYPIYLLLKFVEFFGIKLRTGSDNLLSLMNQNKQLDFTAIEKMDVNIRPFT